MFLIIILYADIILRQIHKKNDVYGTAAVCFWLLFCCVVQSTQVYSYFDPILVTLWERFCCM